MQAKLRFVTFLIEKVESSTTIVRLSNTIVTVVSLFHKLISLQPSAPDNAKVLVVKTVNPFWYLVVD